MDMKMPLDEYYREMDWKPIPDDLCYMLMEYMETSVEAKRDNYTWQRKGHGEFQMHDAPDFIWDWCKDNLPLDFDQFFISVQVIPVHECRAHIDTELRTSSFNFVLTDDRAITSWYDDKLETILESVEYKARTWYHHQGSVFHRITGVRTPPRIGVTIYKII